jgi:hypothetical protein
MSHNDWPGRARAPRHDTPEPPDFEFNVNIVSIEYGTHCTVHSEPRRLTHEQVQELCHRLNDRLIAIGFYDGYRETDFFR